jgi:hypothetical protein
MSFTPTDLTATVDPAVYEVPEDYVAGTLAVLVDGVIQQPGVIYALSGPGNRTVTFAVAPVGWVSGTWQGTSSVTTGHYLTRALLQARVGGEARYLVLTDDDHDNVPDTNVEESVLIQVDLLVDGLARRGGYATPLGIGDVDTILPYLLDVASYRLQARAGGVASEGDQKLYDDAMIVLNNLGTGVFQLPSYQTVAPIANFGFDSGNSIGPVLTRQTLRGF